MTTYILQRLLLLVPVMLGVMVIVFVIMRLVPGDPVRMITGPDVSAEDRELVRKALGLDQPAHIQFVRYVGDLARGNLGRSILTKRPVWDEIRPRFIETLKLAALSIVWVTVFGVSLGVLASIRQHSAVDNASMVLAVLGVCTPSFFLGILLILLFGVFLRVLPAGGLGGIEHMILPALTLGAAPLAVTARLTRASMLEVLGEDYIRTARAKGLREQAILTGHALKNALIPVTTVLGLQLGWMLGGSILVETVFTYPGVGWLLVEAIGVRDFPVVQSAVLLVAGTFVLINLVVDVAYKYLDPRIQY